MQEIKCSDIAPKLGKCQECKMTRSQLDRRENIYCRFIAFRRLKFNSKSVVAVAGFSEPSDADVDDLKLWYPQDAPSSELSVEMAKYLMQNVGDRFCELVEQEKEAMMWAPISSKIIWKRAVQGELLSSMFPVCT